MLGRFVIVAATAGVCLAQRYPFQLYGQGEGLSNLIPMALLQDRSGFLWVGTQNRLFRYDGSRFESIGVSNGLPSSRIASLFETRAGSLLVATSNGVARYSGGRFEPVLFGGEPLTTPRRQGLTEDATGRLYLATDVGLLEGDRPPPSVGAHHRIYSVYRDSKGMIWAGCGTQLCILDGEKLVTVAGELPSAAWRSIRADHLGNLWILGSRTVWVRRKGAVCPTWIAIG